MFRSKFWIVWVLERMMQLYIVLVFFFFFNKKYWSQKCLYYRFLKIILNNQYLLNIREIWMKRSFKLFPVIIFHSRLLNNPSNNAALEFRERWQHATVCCFNDRHPVNYSNLLGKASHYRSLYTLLRSM